MRAVYTFLTLLLLSHAPVALARTAYDCLNPATSGAFLLSDDCQLSGHVTLSGDLDILGVVKGDGSYPVVKAASSSRHFTVNNDHKLTLKYLKMIDGNVGSSNGGSITLDNGNANISHCVFFNNQAVAGGAIRVQWAEEVSNLDFDSVVFNANHATGGSGGALSFERATLVGHFCTFTMNTATNNGGAISTIGSISLFDSTFEGNTAVKDGGGIKLFGYYFSALYYSDLTLTRVTMKENKQTGATDATYGGGGLHLEYYATVNIRESTFIDNEATADSGTGKQGHQILTSKTSSDIPSLTIVNTQFTDIAGGHAFYGYDSASSSGSAATYASPADCSANPCTDVAFPFCTDLGSNGVTCGPPACTSPDSNGYSVVETDLKLASFAVTATCAVSGTATVTACASSGQPYVLSGCMPVYDCLNPATTGAFALTNDCQLSGEVTLSGDLDILGVVKGDGSYPVVKAASSSRHFTVNNDHKLTLKYLKMIDGNVGSSNGGSITLDNGNANISHCVFFNNQAVAGGAIRVQWAEEVSNLDFDSVVFNANHATGGSGGALSFERATLVGHFCTFTMNTATNNGGAISTIGSISLFDSTFEGNTAVKDGGGIKLFGYYFSALYYSDLTLTRVTMKENKQTGATDATYGGGGLHLEYYATVNIRESTFIDNEATADSGTGKHGHQIMTLKGESGTPSVTIVNTQFTDIAGGHAFYGYNDDSSSGSAATYISPADCSANPCTEAPFTHTCAVLGNEGVTCDYDATYLSTYNCGYKTKGTLYPLPPPVIPCSCAVTEFDTSTACQQYRTSCPDGEFLGTDGTATSDHSCTPCEADEKSTGGAPCKKLLDCLTATEQGHRNIDIGFASGDYTVSLS